VGNARGQHEARGLVARDRLARAQRRARVVGLAGVEAVRPAGPRVAAERPERKARAGPEARAASEAEPVGRRRVEARRPAPVVVDLPLRSGGWAAITSRAGKPYENSCLPNAVAFERSS